jgi:hypothetical protein
MLMATCARVVQLACINEYKGCIGALRTTACRANAANLVVTTVQLYPCAPIIYSVSIKHLPAQPSLSHMQHNMYSTSGFYE